MTLASLQQIENLKGHEDPVRLVRFGPNGLMVTADVSMQVVVWQGTEQVRQLDMRAENPRHRPHDRLRSATYNLTGSRLYLAAGTRLVAIDLETGFELWRYHAPEFWPFMLASPLHVETDADGGLLASFDNGSMERRSSELELVFRRKNREAPSWFGLDREGRRLVGTDGHTLTTWNLEDGERTSRLPLEEHAFDFVYNEARDCAAVRYPDRIVLQQVKSQDEVARFPLPPSAPVMGFNKEGNRFAYTSGTDIVVSEVGSRDIRILPAEGLRFVSLCFDHFGNLWTGRADGSVQSWNL